MSRHEQPEPTNLAPPPPPGPPVSESPETTPLGAFRTRFDRFVDRSDGPDACWLWRGSKSGRGYGVFWFDGHQTAATRVAWYLAHGSRPTETQVVRHTCDNPPCVNPAHLLVGSQQENVADMWQRDRAASFAGEAHGQARLTDDDIRNIRERLAEGGTVKEVAAEYGISGRTVRAVRSGERWGHVR